MLYKQQRFRTISLTANTRILSNWNGYSDPSLAIRVVSRSLLVGMTPTLHLIHSIGQSVWIKAPGPPGRPLMRIRGLGFIAKERTGRRTQQVRPAAHRQSAGVNTSVTILNACRTSPSTNSAHFLRLNGTYMRNLTACTLHTPAWSYTYRHLCLSGNMTSFLPG